MSTEKNACLARVFLFVYKYRVKNGLNESLICQNHMFLKFSKKRLNTFERLLYNTNK